MGFPLGEGQHYNKAASPSFQRDRCAIHPFQMTLAAYQCTGNGGQYWSRLLEHLPKWGRQPKKDLWPTFPVFGSPTGKLLHHNYPLINFHRRIFAKISRHLTFCKVKSGNCEGELFCPSGVTQS